MEIELNRYFFIYLHLSDLNGVKVKLNWKSNLRECDITVEKKTIMIRV